MEENSAEYQITTRDETFKKDMIPSVEQLNLAFLNLGQVPSDLGNFKALKYLFLANNKIRSFDGQVFVKSIPELVVLDLSYNLIQNVELIQQLAPLSCLEELNIEGNPLPIADNRPCLIQKLLLFPFCPPLVEEEMNNLAQQFQGLSKGRVSISNTAKKYDIPPLFCKSNPIECTNISPRKAITSRKQRPRSGMKGVEREANSSARKSRPKSSPGISRKPHTERGRNVLDFNDHLETKSTRSEKEKGSPEDRPLFTLQNTNLSSLRKAQSTSNVMKIAKLFNNHRVAEENVDYELDEDERESIFSITNPHHCFLDPPEPIYSPTDKRKPLAYKSKSKEDAKMKLFFEEFIPSDMTPFITSGRKLFNKPKHSKMIIEKIQPCPVPRPSSTPFPMLKVLNRKAITKIEYMVAENEEIFDICMHADKPPSFVRNEKKLLKERSEKDSDSQNLKEEEIERLFDKVPDYSLSRDEDYLLDLIMMDSPQNVKEYQIISKEKKEKKLQKEKERNDDLSHRLWKLNSESKGLSVRTFDQTINNIKSSDILSLIDGASEDSGDDIPGLDYKGLKRFQGKNSRRPSSSRISQQSASRRWEYLQNKLKTDKIIGNRRPTVDHRPLKQQLLDMSKEEVELKLIQMQIEQTIVERRNTLKHAKLDPEQWVKQMLKEQEQKKSSNIKKMDSFSDITLEESVEKKHSGDDPIIAYYSNLRKQVRILKKQRSSMVYDRDSRGERKKEDHKERKKRRQSMASTLQSITIGNQRFTYSPLFV